MDFLIKLIIKRIKDMEKNGKENEHLRETLKLEPEKAIKKGSKPTKCC